MMDITKYKKNETEKIREIWSHLKSKNLNLVELYSFSQEGSKAKGREAREDGQKRIGGSNKAGKIFKKTGSLRDK